MTSSILQQTSHLLASTCKQVISPTLHVDDLLDDRDVFSYPQQSVPEPRSRYVPFPTDTPNVQTTAYTSMGPVRTAPIKTKQPKTKEPKTKAPGTRTTKRKNDSTNLDAPVTKRGRTASNKQPVPTNQTLIDSYAQKSTTGNEPMPRISEIIHKIKGCGIPDVPTYSHDGETSQFEMEIRTARGPYIKKVVEIISPLLTDAVLRFQEDGLHIIAMDGVRVAVVQVILEARTFEKYYLRDPTRTYDICVDTSNFNKVLTAMNGYDVISFVFQNDTPEGLQNLWIYAKNKNQRESFKIRVFGINPRNEKFEIPDQKYDSMMSIPSKDFDKHIHDLSLLGNTVTFRTDYHKFVMIVRGEFNQSYKVIYPSHEGLSFSSGDANAADSNAVDSNVPLADGSEAQQAGGSQSEENQLNSAFGEPVGDAVEDEEVQLESVDDFLGMSERTEDDGDVPSLIDELAAEVKQIRKEVRERKKKPITFDYDPEIEFEGDYTEATHIIKYLKAFCKARDLSSKVHIYFARNQPLVLTYKIGNMGLLTYCIVDVNDNKNDEEDEEQA